MQASGTQWPPNKTDSLYPLAFTNAFDFILKCLLLSSNLSCEEKTNKFLFKIISFSRKPFLILSLWPRSFQHLNVCIYNLFGFFNKIMSLKKQIYLFHITPLS